jgi:alpha-L-fucosidase
VRKNAFLRTIIAFSWAASLVVPGRMPGAPADSGAALRFGVITDLHYADRGPIGGRHYRESTGKLAEFVAAMNDARVDFVIELGDFKDQDIEPTPERTRGFLSAIEAVFARFQGPRYHVLGNHDEDSISKPEFLARAPNTGMPAEKTYYSFDKKDFHFVVLDANFKADGVAYERGRYAWADANLPPPELGWLKADLAAAGPSAVVFIHQQLDGSGDYYVKNAAAVRAVLESSGRVRAVFQGHRHEGAFSTRNGIPYYTLKAACEGEPPEGNSYALVEATAETGIRIKGFGKADSMDIGKPTPRTPAQGPGVVYQPDWASLDARPTPQWFRDAKFGIFICWGLYSVPAWSPKGQYAEWYQYWLQEKALDGTVAAYHEKKYGPDFKYADFAPLFKAELWDPAAWADLVAKSGAKYMVLTTKHHAGDCLWPSAEASRAYGRPWNTIEMGPRRDVVGELSAAMRAKGIKAGLYYSLYEWYHPLWLADKPRFIAEHFFPQFKDLVTRYAPDILWADGEWELDSTVWRTPELLAWLFNTAPNRDSVVINDRWGKDTRHKHGGFYTTEYGSGLDDDSRAWEENRGIGMSYGYNSNEDAVDYKSAHELVLMLIDVVSRGGNLCLDIGPRADGKIPSLMEERLLQIGEWLRRNGEAIYGTRTWNRPCQWSEGARPQAKRGEFMTGFDILRETLQPPPGQAVKEAFFTFKDGALYALTPKWPGRRLLIKNLELPAGARASLLGDGRELHWKKTGGDVSIELPDYDPAVFTPEHQYAYVFKVAGVRAR